MLQTKREVAPNGRSHDAIVADKSSTKTVEERADEKVVDQRQAVEVLLSILFYLRWQRGGFCRIKKLIVIRGKRKKRPGNKPAAENWEFEQRQMKGSMG